MRMTGRLAEHRRQRRHAQVDRTPAHRELDAAVLRQPRLGDVEIGHDLDARDQRLREMRRRRLELEQRTVDAVADLEVPFERLEVHVGGLVADRLVEHVVQQFDDGRRLGHRGLVLEVDLAALLLQLGHELVHALLALGRVLAVVAIESLLDQRAVGDQALDLAPGREAEVGQHRHVRGVGDRDLEHLALQAHGQDRERARGREIDLRDGLLRGWNRGEVVVREPSLARERARDVGGLDALHRDEDLADAAALLALHGERLLHHALVDETELLEDLAEQSTWGHRFTPVPRPCAAPGLCDRTRVRGSLLC
jgi:hypothetical protein